MKGGIEGLDLLQEIVGQPLSGDDRQAGNVVDRLFRIKLGALSAGARQDVDQMRADVEQPQFEHREQPGRTGADDDDVRFDYLAHLHPSPLVKLDVVGGRGRRAFSRHAL